MRKVLIPVDRSRNCKLAVRQAITEFMSNPALEIHLVNVQPAFSRHVAQFVSHRNLEEFHLAEARKALAPSTAMLDMMNVPHSVHVEVGERARCITQLAERLGCDLILMGTARKNSLTRLVEDSVTTHVLELAKVPVEVISGESVSDWERFGIPAALAGGAAAALYAVAG